MGTSTGKDDRNLCGNVSGCWLLLKHFIGRRARLMSANHIQKNTSIANGQIFFYFNSDIIYFRVLSRTKHVSGLPKKESRVWVNVFQVVVVK